MANDPGPAPPAADWRQAASLWAATAPQALGCTIAELVHQTPQWLIFGADSGGREGLAWLFLPAALAPDRLSRREQIEAPGRAYAVHAADAATSFSRLAGLEKPLPCAPAAMAHSEAHGLLWMRTAAPAPRLSSLAPPNPAVAAIIARGLTAALAQLHGLNILHLDVHPQLVGCDAQRRISLCGFGTDVRRSLLASEADNRRLARPRFSAPELWDASGRTRLGPWTDIYSAAATIFQTLTGAAPADFRTRLRDPAAARADLVGRMREAFAATGIDGDAMADAIADGLEPRLADRPRDLSAWGKRMEISPVGGWRAAGAPEPAKAGAAQGEEKPAPARPKPSPRTARAGPGHSRLAALYAFIALMLAAPIALWLLVRPGPSAEVPITNELDTRELEKVVRPMSGPSTIARGVSAGYAFEDDPARLSSLLRTQFDRPLRIGDPAGRLFFAHREPLASTCAKPLRLHLRRDGQGLLVERPAGLVWVTSWDDTSPRGTVDIGLRIESVWNAAGRVDAPGLAGTRRRVRLSQDGIAIGFVDDDGVESGDPERYERCAA